MDVSTNRGVGRPIEKSDLWIAAAFMAAFLFHGLPFLGSLEFYRHTEADRTLIAWEMLQRRDFILPHLLGDVYLTKPPLYYSFLALAFWIAGTPTEFAARSVSVVSAALLVGLQYFFLRRFGWSRLHAAFSATILATSPLFFDLAWKAEIDMSFALFSVTSMYLLLLTLTEAPSYLRMLLTAAMIACAFLIKGPQILVFAIFGAGALIWRRKTAHPMTAYAKPVLAGMVLFLALIGLWVLGVSLKISWEDLRYHLNEEIIVRFFGDREATRRARSYWFYIVSISMCLFPWSLLFLGFLRRDVARAAGEVRASPLVVFSAGVVICSLILFSLASGKSNRYLFPIYPLVANLAVIGADRLLLPKERAIKLFAALTALILLMRIPYLAFYVPRTNKKMMVPAWAKRLDSRVPDEATLYILEFPRRWFIYYMVRAGRDVKRITPQTAALLRDSEREEYVVIDRDVESRRLQALEERGASVRNLDSFEGGRSRLSLVAIPGKDLHLFEPKRIFPTHVPKEIPAGADVGVRRGAL